MDIVVPALIAVLALWILISGLCNGVINAGSLRLFRSDDPIAYWSVAIIAGLVSLISTWMAVTA